MDTETFTAETRQKVTSYLVQDAVKWLLGAHDNKAMSALSGLIRHILTATGTFGAIHGTLTSDQVMQITGIVVAALPTAVSVARHWSVEILARIDAIINRRALPPSGPGPVAKVAGLLLVCFCLSQTGCASAKHDAARTDAAFSSRSVYCTIIGSTNITLTITNRIDAGATVGLGAGDAALSNGTAVAKSSLIPTN